MIFSMLNAMLGGIPTTTLADAGAAGQGPPPWAILPYFLLMFGILYLLMIRPQQKQQKELRQKLAAMSKGDKVITSGGIHGIVANFKDNIVIVRIAENVKIEVSRSHIADVLPKPERTSDN